MKLSQRDKIFLFIGKLVTGIFVFGMVTYILGIGAFKLYDKEWS